MTTYSLIVKNIIKTDKNFFDLNYKDDGVNCIFKIYFNLHINNIINTKSKFKFFMDTLNNIFIKGVREEEFINFFCKIQKTYNCLNRLVYNYKYKKASIVVNTDMGLNEITLNSKNIICIFHSGSKYLFHINDLIKIINVSLTNSYMFFSEPVAVKNPYNNLPFKKSDLYNIYFFIKYQTNYYPELLFKFYEVDFNLTIFKNKNEYLLREKAIHNFVFNSTSQILIKHIKIMISNHNKKNKLYEIIINEDFPKDKLIKIFQPYLLLYFISQYTFLEYKKFEARNILNYSLKRFQKFNPQFGRKKYKILMGYRKNFKKYIKKKLIEFDDRHIKFNDVEYQNESFLDDHLKYEENNNEYIGLHGGISYNILFIVDEEERYEYEEDEEVEDEEVEDEVEDEEEEEVEDEGDNEIQWEDDGNDEEDEELEEEQYEDESIS